VGPVSRDEFIALAMPLCSLDTMTSTVCTTAKVASFLISSEHIVFSPLMPKDMSVGTASLHIDDLEKSTSKVHSRVHAGLEERAT